MKRCVKPQEFCSGTIKEEEKDTGGGDEDVVWTPEELIDVKKRRLFGSVADAPFDGRGGSGGGGKNPVFDALNHHSRQSTPAIKQEPQDQRDTKSSLKERMDTLVQQDSPPVFDRQRAKEETNGKKETAATLLFPGDNLRADLWQRSNTSRQEIEEILSVARKEGREFDTLCALAEKDESCEPFAGLYALTERASVRLAKRYIDAYMRERVTVRKFEMENTPTKRSLEPYYRFREEKEEPETWGEEGTEGTAHWCRTTFTLTAPCVRVCWAGIDGAPPVSRSRSGNAAWSEHCDQSVAWERIKTKNWSIRNPLVRMLSIHAQAHSSCTHARQVEEWLQAAKKNWPLAKQRKVWKEHSEWHEHPTLNVPLCTE